MYSKKILFSLSLLAVLILSNNSIISTMASTSKMNSSEDEIFKTVSLTLVNATIYDDRSITGAGNIYFTITIENQTYFSTITQVNADPKNPYTYTINMTVTQNISLTASHIDIQVRDAGNGTFNSPDYLGYFNITNLAVGTVINTYNTTGAIGGSSDPQASAFVKTVIVQHNDIIPPIISLNTKQNMTVLLGSSDNYLNFSIYDDNPNYYNITKNNVTLFSGGWKNDQTILYNIDGLAKGLYNYTITAFDMFEANTTINVLVNVTNVINGTTVTGTGNTSQNGDNRTNRSIPFAGPEFIILGLVACLIVFNKRSKLN